MPVDDENAMKEAMIKVLNEPKIRQNFENVAYNRAKFFDSENIASELINFLENPNE